MTTQVNQLYPKSYLEMYESTVASGFTMASEVMTCSLLRTLAASKPSGKFLELGTGTGLSTAWILDGMDDDSSLISIDHDEKCLAIAKHYLHDDQRLSLIQSDGGDWIEMNKNLQFDFIFADTWHGKYLMLNEVLSMLKSGGLYIIDDMLLQPNWPDGHEEKVNDLVKELESKTQLEITKQNWASGIIIAVKK